MVYGDVNLLRGIFLTLLKSVHNTNKMRGLCMYYLQLGNTQKHLVLFIHKLYIHCTGWGDLNFEHVVCKLCFVL